MGCGVRSLAVAALMGCVGFAQPRMYELAELPSPGPGLNYVVWVGEDGGMIGSLIDLSAVPQTARCYVYAEGEFRFLDTPGFECYARDANGKGEFVGSLALSLSFTGAGDRPPRRGFVYRGGAFQLLVTALAAPRVVLDSAAHAINESGDIVGTVSWYDPVSATSTVDSWLHTGGELKILPDLGGRGTRALAINDPGDIAGDSMTAAQEQHAVVITREGGLIDLGTLGGNRSSAFAINALGQTAGQSLLSNDARAPAMAFFHTGSAMLPIHVEGAAAGTSAVSLNDAGEVVGVYYALDRAGVDVPRAFYYFGGRTVPLLSLVADAPPGLLLTSPVWIDNSGRILTFGGLEGDSATRTYLLTPLESAISARRWRRR
jgi:probable HAF family extracellular repeat protein